MRTLQNSKTDYALQIIQVEHYNGRRSATPDAYLLTRRGIAGTSVALAMSVLRALAGNNDGHTQVGYPLL